MQDHPKQARRIVREWPTGGCVIGVLPDGSRPRRSGQAVLDLIEAAREGREPVAVLDLAPGRTDLGSRFEVGGGPGLAELESGEVELWEIARRDDDHGVVYLSRGRREAAGSLAGSDSSASLADEIREKGGLLLLIVDGGDAEALDAAGYADGFVRIGTGGDAGRPDVGEPARLAARREELPESSEAAGATGEPRLVVTPEMRESTRARKLSRRGLVALAVLVLVGVGAYATLDGSVPRALAEATGFFADTGNRAEATAPVGPGSSEPSPAQGRTSVPSPSPRSAVDGSTAAASPGEAPDTSAVSVPAGSEASVGGEAPATVTDEGAAEEKAEPSGRETGSERDDVAPDVPRASPGSGGPPAFRAIADSLAWSVNRFGSALEFYREGRIGCAELIELRDRADRLFERLWLGRMALQPRPDSAANATFRRRAREIEAVQRSFGATACRADSLPAG